MHARGGKGAQESGTGRGSAPRPAAGGGGGVGRWACNCSGCSTVASTSRSEAVTLAAAARRERADAQARRRPTAGQGGAGRCRVAIKKQRALTDQRPGFLFANSRPPGGSQAVADSSASVDCHCAAIRACGRLFSPPGDSAARLAQQRQCPRRFQGRHQLAIANDIKRQPHRRPSALQAPPRLAPLPTRALSRPLHRLRLAMSLRRLLGQPQVASFLQQAACGSTPAAGGAARPFQLLQLAAFSASVSEGLVGRLVYGFAQCATAAAAACGSRDLQGAPA